MKHMLVKAEVWIEVPGISEADSRWDGMMLLGSLLSKSYIDVRKIRMPDSPEPDVTGTLNFNKQT